MSTDLNSPFTLLDRIAKALAVDPSFIEKDWYAMRLISTLMEVQDSHFQLVFSGGTSLSKGFGLIQRFSEDLDFKVLMLQPNTTRKDRQNFREQLLATIEANDVIWTVDRQSLQSGNRSGFFKIPISYQPQYIIAPVLRPYIQIEITFEPPLLQPESRSLQSFVSAAQKGDPEVHNILCVSPLETAADKLSSLSWRVIDRDRSSLGDDPTLVRHLHDLAVLAPSILGQNENALQTLALQILEKDTSRAKPDTASLIISARLQRMVDILKTDIVYETEYHNFVIGMSYARDEDRIPYKKALESLQTLTSFLLQENSSNENLREHLTFAMSNCT